MSEGSKPMKYAKWANLNREGLKHWGAIFKDGIVPIKGNIFPSKAEVAETKEPLEVYLVDWDELNQEQKDAVLQKLSDKFKATKEEIFKDILKVGLPLQSKYVGSVGFDGRLIA